MKLIVTFMAVIWAFGANAGVITEFTDRASFDAAVGSTTLEDFGDEAVLGIPDGKLSSESDFTGNVSFLGRAGTISPGDIMPGAVYTTPIGVNENYFNIDAGAAFVGGMLDGFEDLVLTITYDPLIAAFGFDTNLTMGDFAVTINFVAGDSYSKQFQQVAGYDLEFFGFQSEYADIASVQIDGGGFGNVAFRLDNHSFGGTGSSLAVPEPSSVLLLAIGLVFLAHTGRRKFSGNRTKLI